MEMPTQQVAHTRTGTTRNHSRLRLAPSWIHRFGHALLLHYERWMDLHLLRFQPVRLAVGHPSMAGYLYLAGQYLIFD